MLTTPVLVTPINPFDARDDYEVQFYVEGGGQVVRNRLVIEDMSTGVEVYNHVAETFSNRHTIPMGTLSNGVQYEMYVATGGINNKWSNDSERESFYCFSKAAINIPTIAYSDQNRVYNQTVTFEATYTQSENETPESFRFLLFDSNRNLIKSFPEQFYASTGVIEQEIAGLEDGQLYYIQVKTISVNGLLTDTDLVWFKPFYVVPKLSAVLTPTNQKEDGAIKISSNIVQIIGKLYDNNGNEIAHDSIEYLEGSKLDLTRPDYKELVFGGGFDIMQEEFMLKLWCQKIKEDVVFSTLRGEKGKIDLVKRDNRIHAYKSGMGHDIVAHFASDVFNFSLASSYMIYIKQKNSLIHVEVKEY